MRKEILYTHREIEHRVSQLAKQIALDYRGKDLLLIGVLNGSIMLAADLLRELWNIGFHEIKFDTIKVSSYGTQLASSGDPQLAKDIRLEVRGQHLLIVEDIVDSGLTLNRMVAYLQEKDPASVEILALLSKPPSVRKQDVLVKYIGFEIENVWVEGYGIDSAETGRGNPNIMRVLQVE
jgi:hypoxanthine phosphoribosyltransferase